MAERLADRVRRQQAGGDPRVPADPAQLSAASSGSWLARSAVPYRRPSLPSSQCSIDQSFAARASSAAKYGFGLAATYVPAPKVSNPRSTW
jgi:hypothetical protein